VFVIASKKGAAIAKAIAYYTTELIKAVKSFMIEAPGKMKDWKKVLTTIIKKAVFTSFSLYKKTVGNISIPIVPKKQRKLSNLLGPYLQHS
jgi:hypothetical protein